MANNVTFVFGFIVCILGFLVVWVVYYFWKLQNRSDLDYSASAKVGQRTGKQNREHPRVDINWPVSLETSDGAIAAQVKNISVGGAFICCQKPLPIGEMFRFTMAGLGNVPVKATAKVVWSNTNVPDDKVINRGM